MILILQYFSTDTAVDTGMVAVLLEVDMEHPVEELLLHVSHVSSSIPIDSSFIQVVRLDGIRVEMRVEDLPEEEEEMEEDEAVSEGSFILFYYFILLIFLHKNKIKVKIYEGCGEGGNQSDSGKIGPKQVLKCRDRNETRVKEND